MQELRIMLDTPTRKETERNTENHVERFVLKLYGKCILACSEFQYIHTVCVSIIAMRRNDVHHRDCRN